MADLTVNFAGIELKNPFIVSSGPCTNCLIKIEKAEKNGFSGVVTKLALPVGSRRLGSQDPSYSFDNSRWTVIADNTRKDINLNQPRGKGVKDADPRLLVPQVIKLIKAAKKKTDLVIIANMEGPTNYGEGIEEWGKIATAFEEAGADMIELNTARHITKYKKGIGEIPELFGEIVKVVKKSVSIPVIGKMPCQENDVLKDFTACGIDGFSGPHGGMNVRSPLCTPPFIDIYNDGKDLAIGLLKGQGHHLVPQSVRQPQRTLTNWWASVVYQTVNLPILSVGGFETWQHVVEAIMWGATAVGFQTIIMKKGFEVLEDMIKGFEAYMDEQGYSNLNDFRGTALKYVTDEPIEYEPLAAKINEEKCDGCKQCTRIGHCIAITFSSQKKKASVDPVKCVSCAWCLWKCPRNAIFMVSYPKPRLIDEYLLSED